MERLFLKDYNTANKALRHSYSICALLLLPLLIWLRYRIPANTESDTAAEASMRVLRRPFSTWLLLAASGLLIIDADAPLILHQLVFFTVLVPVLRLLPPQIYAMLGPWPYIISGLYLLDLLGFALVSNTFYHRCYILFITSLALALLVWGLLRSRRKAVANDSMAAPASTSRIVRNTSWGAIVILTVSLIANLFGIVSLAEMLTNALLFSAYVGLVLYASVDVVISVLTLMITRRSTNRFGIVSRHGSAFLRGATRLLQFAAVIGGVLFTLNQFRVFRPLYQFATTVLPIPSVLDQ